MSSHVHLQWAEASPVLRFRTGISLHSHTLHSREHLDFIYKAAATVPVLAAAMRHGEQRYKKIHGAPLDLRRGWWTPPLGAHGAWELERNQIEDLDLDALVSLTDHDDIEAPVSLQLLDECREVPVSLEWTVPFGPTFFHLGVHNLPRAEARMLFEVMDCYRSDPHPGILGGILAELTARPGLLIVFNHPLWDEVGIGQEAHGRIAREFLGQFGGDLHALEINGLRPWRENRAVLQFAASAGKPAISGGDRHVLEPNAVLNLTNAATFAEFAEEVREGWSDVLILRHYRQSHSMRILHNMVDVLRTYERHANGWRLWSDRVFYECQDGSVRSLTELFGGGAPLPVTAFVSAMQLMSAPPIRRLLYGAFSSAEEVGL
jgi:hypothetical protein